VIHAYLGYNTVHSRTTADITSLIKEKSGNTPKFVTGYTHCINKAILRPGNKNIDHSVKKFLTILTDKLK
jgi:hypothetical protein